MSVLSWLLVGICVWIILGGEVIKVLMGRVGHRGFARSDRVCKERRKHEFVGGKEFSYKGDDDIDHHSLPSLFGYVTLISLSLI